MALKLKKYTDDYSGLDGSWYLDRNAPFIVICTNRNAGKTTNILGEILNRNKGFLLLTRYKKEIPFFRSKLLKACKYYNKDVKWDKKKDAFIDADGNEVGYIAALTGVNDEKNRAERYSSVDYIVFDEFLPADGKYYRETSTPGFELEALFTIIGSVRKGEDGEFNRDIKIVLMANLVDALNPYLCGMLDSTGTSLLTTLAKTITSGQTNVTLDDPYIFFTVHIDPRFEKKDVLSEILSRGSGNGGIATKFIRDFSEKIRFKNNNIEAQLKRPLLSTGTATMYLITLKTSIDIGASSIDLQKQVYYWVPSKRKPSDEQMFDRYDMDEYQHWYSNIVTKAEVKDFMLRYNQQKKTGV